MFGTILHTLDFDAPKEGKSLTNYVQNNIQLYWNKLDKEIKQKYFKKQKVSDLKIL